MAASCGKVPSRICGMVSKVGSLIKEHKLARTEEEYTQVEAHLKKCAQAFYKQDPTLKSIRDKGKEMTKQIRAILFEENRSKQIDKIFER